MLTRLMNGSWVDIRIISSIRAFEHPPRVVIRGNDFNDSVKFDDLEQAKAYCETLGEMVNRDLDQQDTRHPST